eukprot:3434001-Amphidinium_carterae.1
MSKLFLTHVCTLAALKPSRHRLLCQNLGLYLGITTHQVDDSTLDIPTEMARFLQCSGRLGAKFLDALSKIIHWCCRGALPTPPANRQGWATQGLGILHSTPLLDDTTAALEKRAGHCGLNSMLSMEATTRQENEER